MRTETEEGKSHLQPFDNFFNIFTANEALHRNTLSPLIEDFEAGVTGRPPYHISAGAVESHAFCFLLDEDDELVGDPEEAVELHGLVVVFGPDGPHDGPHATELSSWVRLRLFLLLGGQRNEWKLARRVNRCVGDILFCQIFQVFLAGPCGHGPKLFWFVSSIFCIDHFGQKEVPEHIWLGESDPFRDGRSKRRHISGPSDGHAEDRAENKKGDACQHVSLLLQQGERTRCDKERDEAQRKAPV